MDKLQGKGQNYKIKTSGLVRYKSKIVKTISTMQQNNDANPETMKPLIDLLKQIEVKLNKFRLDGEEVADWSMSNVKSEKMGNADVEVVNKIAYLLNFIHIETMILHGINKASAIDPKLMSERDALHIQLQTERARCVQKRELLILSLKQLLRERHALTTAMGIDTERLLQILPSLDQLPAQQIGELIRSSCIRCTEMEKEKSDDDGAVGGGVESVCFCQFFGTKNTHDRVSGQIQIQINQIIEVLSPREVVAGLRCNADQDESLTVPPLGTSRPAEGRRRVEMWADNTRVGKSAWSRESPKLTLPLKLKRAREIHLEVWQETGPSKRMVATATLALDSLLKRSQDNRHHTVFLEPRGCVSCSINASELNISLCTEHQRSHVPVGRAGIKRSKMFWANLNGCRLMRPNEANVEVSLWLHWFKHCISKLIVPIETPNTKAKISALLDNDPDQTVGAAGEEISDETQDADIDSQHNKMDEIKDANSLDNVPVQDVTPQKKSRRSFKNKIVRCVLWIWNKTVRSSKGKVKITALSSKRPSTDLDQGSFKRLRTDSQTRSAPVCHFMQHLLPAPLVQPHESTPTLPQLCQSPNPGYINIQSATSTQGQSQPLPLSQSPRPSSSNAQPVTSTPYRGQKHTANTAFPHYTSPIRRGPPQPCHQFATPDMPPLRSGVAGAAPSCNWTVPAPPSLQVVDSSPATSSPDLNLPDVGSPAMPCPDEEDADEDYDSPINSGSSSDEEDELGDQLNTSRRTRAQIYFIKDTNGPPQTNSLCISPEPLSDHNAEIATFECPAEESGMECEPELSATESSALSVASNHGSSSRSSHNSDTSMSEPTLPMSLDEVDAQSDDTEDESVEFPAADENVDPAATADEGSVARGERLLSQMKLVTVLGSGFFGKVLLARYTGPLPPTPNSKQKQPLVALKCISKKRITSDVEYLALFSERYVLQTINKYHSNFVVGFYGCFMTADYLIFAMEYASAGDLMSHIQARNFTEKEAQFYGACVLLALEHLHTKKIMYRDLKLDNVLMDRRGYVKLADFGLSKPRMGAIHRTYTFCGTLEFLAPEIVRDRCYTRVVDWWAFGVFMYELIRNESPFSGGKDSDVIERIQTGKFNQDKFSPTALLLVKRLLQVDPKKRLGRGLYGHNDVKRHPFFVYFDFDALIARTLPPPFVPQLSGPADTKYFEEEFTSQPLNLRHSEEDQLPADFDPASIPDNIFDTFDQPLLWERLED